LPTILLIYKKFCLGSKLAQVEIYTYAKEGVTMIYQRQSDGC